MFTRTNIVVATLLFLLFFILFLILFSVNGVLKSNETKLEMDRLSTLVERKSAEVELLRSSERSENLCSEWELLISYQGNPVVVETQEEGWKVDSFKPFSYFSIFFLSLIPSLIYILIVYLISLFKRRQR